ncbi:PIN2/TERF1-interacting telomerase inhibitor 1 isoform X2 [Lucilia sericata]|uniref:PIN2/TERF1-interacting telomerase inhibitor 1 isoform X2 n=1 Tax=Lucilia sericata TaxID=13632 RepID=UPI0018A7F22D|nr:PIN2/TERF1-interacting telomerase inhibitor 1 isoform X2 [Lucilia sericata]
MAMLAEPRQRKRYNLVPRGKALYEDDSRFGTKMLEKMGWEKGKGLGAKEDGSKDFVRIRYKNDILGLGFEHRDDQWTQHEQSFNGLLKTLNNENVDDDANKKQENGNESDAEDMPRMGFGFQDSSVNDEKKPKVEKLKEKISGISLEERSKQSKARVHYKKFTKGKDLAQYSEKDLANIFGKKAADEQKAANDFYSQLSRSFEKKSEEINDKQEDNEGANIINTGVSVNDYFKTKMEAIKNRKNGLDSGENSLSMKSESNEEQLEEEELTKKQKKKNKKERKEQQLEEENNQEQEKKETTDGLMIYSNVSVTDYFKMKMEAIKNKKNGLNNAEKNIDNALTNDQKQEPEVIRKKKKSKKERKDLEIEPDNGAIIEEKKSKKRKSNPDQETENNYEMGEEAKKASAEDVIELVSEDTTTKMGKTENKSQEPIVEPIEEVDLTNKKSKKRKHKTSSYENLMSPDNTEGTTELELTQEPTKKKKKKSKAKEPKEIIEIADSDNEEKPLDENVDSLTQKKKKKSKKSKESNENSDKEISSSTTNQTVNASDQATNKPDKVKRKDKNSAI